MIREKLTVKVSGDSKDDITEEIIRIVRDYLEKDVEDEELLRLVDIELDVEADGTSYSATAYVRIKN
jgi:putative lipoic acid-binding regulatory protein